MADTSPPTVTLPLTPELAAASGLEPGQVLLKVDFRGRSGLTGSCLTFFRERSGTPGRMIDPLFADLLVCTAAPEAAS